MIISGEQYRRGLVSWEPADAPLTVVVKAVREDGSLALSSNLTDGRGTLVDVDTHDRVQIESLLPPGAPAITRFRFERDEATSLWSGPPQGECLNVVHIPDFGEYFRLVLDASAANWDSDAVVLVGTTRVRFHTGEISGERAAPIDQVEFDDGGQVTMTGDASGSATVQGKFLEIVAAGEDAEAAETNALTFLGLVRLVVGPLGGVVFAEHYVANPGEFAGSLRIPITALPPSRLSPEASQVIESGIGLLVDSTTPRGVHVALRWYQKACQSRVPEDQVAALVIAIETIANSYSPDEVASATVGRRRKALQELRPQLQKLLQPSDIPIVSNSFQYLTLGEKFDHYAFAKGLDKGDRDCFRDANRLRNDLFHGRKTEVDGGAVSPVRRLLEKILKLELGYQGEFPWENAPRIVGNLTLGYSYHPDTKSVG